MPAPFHSIGGVYQFPSRKRQIALDPNDLRGLFDPVIEFFVFSIILSHIKLPDATFEKVIHICQFPLPIG